MTTTPGLSEKELSETFDIWQLNMLNCCNFELTFLPIEETKMLVLLPDGIYLRIVQSYLISWLGGEVNDHKKYTIAAERTRLFEKSIRLFAKSIRSLAKNIRLLFESISGLRYPEISTYHSNLADRLLSVERSYTSSFRIGNFSHDRTLYVWPDIYEPWKRLLNSKYDPV